MPDKQLLRDVIDRLPDAELVAATRYVQFLLNQESPVAPDMLARIDQARANPSDGISHEDMLREFGI